MAVGADDDVENSDDVIAGSENAEMIRKQIELGLAEDFVVLGDLSLGDASGGEAGSEDEDGAEVVVLVQRGVLGEKAELRLVDVPRAGDAVGDVGDFSVERNFDDAGETARASDDANRKNGIFWFLNWDGSSSCCCGCCRRC